MSPAAERLCRQMVTEILDFIQAEKTAPVMDIEKARALHRLEVRAADTLAAMNEPLRLAPYRDGI